MEQDPFAKYAVKSTQPVADPFAQFAVEPPKPKGNVVQRVLSGAAEDLRNPLSRASAALRQIAPLPGMDWLARQMGAGQLDTLAHPVENAPALAAMAATGGVGGAAVKSGLQAARPVLSALARSGAAAGGGAAGALLRGDSGSEAIGRGATEGAFQAIPDVGLSALQGPLRSWSRHIVNASLRPSNAVLNQLKDPVTGRQFGDLELAAKHFGERALDIQPTGTPGRSTYRQGLTDQLAERQDQLQQTYRLDPQIRVPDSDVTPPGLFDRFAGNTAERGTRNAPAELGKAEQIVEDILKRSEVIPGGYRAGTNMPIARQAARPNEWTLPQMDKLQKGLQDDLSDFYKQQQGAEMFGGPMPDKTEMEVKQVLRDNLSNLTTQHSPVPGLTQRLKSEIHERVPYERAALEATQPNFSNSTPRARIATQGGGLRFQLFDYLGGKSARLARPIRTASRAVAPIGAQSPQLARLISLFMNSREVGDER